MRKLILFTAFFFLALLYTGPGLLPERILVPMDLPSDFLAWKQDPTIRVRVSNSLLSDVPLQKVPWDLEARRLLWNGEMPWRNQFAGDDAHLFANPLAAQLAPFTWLRLVFGLKGWAWSVLLKLLVGGLGMFWLARIVGAGPLGAFLSGSVFTLSGYATVWALFPHTNVFVVLPAVGAAALALSREPSARRVVILGLMAAVATAGGHPETLFVGIVAIAIWIVVQAPRRKLTMALAALAGFLLVGIQLVPFAYLLQRSHLLLIREEQLGTFFRKFSLLSLALPGYLGSPLKGELDLTGLFAGMENFHQRNGAFLGALALLSIVVSWHRLNRPLRAGVIIGAAAFLFSLSPPFLIRAWRMIPVVGGTAAEYFAVAFVLFFSLAAGPSLENVVRNGVRRKLGGMLILVGTLTAVGGALPWLAPSRLERAANQVIDALRGRGHLQQPREVYETRLAWYLDAARGTALRRVTTPAICWALFGVALWMPPGRSRLTIGTLVAVGELFSFGWGYNPAIPESSMAQPPPMLREVMSRDPHNRWLFAASSEVFPPNLSTLWRVRDVRAYDVLSSREAVQRLLPAGYDPLPRALPLVPSEAQLHSLASLGVRYYLTPQGVIEIPTAQLPAPPSNMPPDGLALGVIASIAGGVLLILVAFRTRRMSRDFVAGPSTRPEVNGADGRPG